MERISVLMGIYNCAPYLQEALDSLYAQTCQKFKIILCDDGSKDDTYAIAQRNAEEHSNIVLIKNERNMGLNYTLNHCLEYADTEYCARMDGDDVSLPTRFEKELEFLEKNKEYAIVSSSMSLFDENGTFGSRIESGEGQLSSFLTSTPHCHAPSMVRTEALRDIGGYTVDKKLLRVEDVDLWLRFYMKGYRGYNLKDQLYAMRDNRNAALRRNWQNRKNEMRIRARAIRELQLPFSKNIYILRPLILYLIPTVLYSWLHRRKVCNDKNMRP